MNFYIAGCGSIGKRHIGNLQRIPSCEITAFDPSLDRREEVKVRFGVKVFETFEEGLGENPDAVVIASPSSFHLEQAGKAAKAGVHLFIEKPISHNMAGVDDLIRTANEKNIVVLMGYNMRYHPGLRQIKKILNKGGIGRILSARVQCGQYLPDWHPEEDYRKGYSARSELGGGIILDASHEIDYLRWFLGEVKEVFAFVEKLSSLEIDTEDTSEILLKFDSGAIGEVHLDYVQRAKSRDCQIIGEEGTVIWNVDDDCVRIYTAVSKKWEELPLENGFNFNETYINEIKYFIDCIERNEKTYPDGTDGKRVLEIVIAAKQSSLEKKLVTLSKL